MSTVSECNNVVLYHSLSKLNNKPKPWYLKVPIVSFFILFRLLESEGWTRIKALDSHKLTALHTCCFVCSTIQAAPGLKESYNWCQTRLADTAFRICSSLEGGRAYPNTNIVDEKHYWFFPVLTLFHLNCCTKLKIFGPMIFVHIYQFKVNYEYISLNGNILASKNKLLNKILTSWTYMYVHMSPTHRML